MNNTDILEEKIKNVKKYNTYNYTWTEKDIDEIQTLIAENKELKEENEELKNEQSEVKISVSAHNRIMQLEEENARLKNKNSFDVYKMGQESQRSRIERDYIPKIKVREALKEEQERLKKGLGKFYNNDLGNSATRILQSLLEKE